MTTLSRSSLAVSVFAAVLLSGCFSLKPSAPTTRYYVLGARPDVAETDVSAGRSDVTIGLKKLSLAPYLEGVRIVAREGENRILFAEFDRWGEDLDRAINRTVAAHLARLLPVRRVEAAPWTAGTRPDLVVQLRVQRFEGVYAGGTGGAAHLLCSWEVTDAVSQELVASGSTDHLENGWDTDDYDRLVSMLDDALLVLARDIAAEIPSI